MRRRVPDERTAIFTIRLTPSERAAVARAARKHVATPHRHPSRIGNFKGWVQMRKTLLGEAVFSGGAA
jgi:hypothetical protein